MHAERVPGVYQMSGGLLTRKGYWLEVLGGGWGSERPGYFN